MKNLFTKILLISGMAGLSFLNSGCNRDNQEMQKKENIISKRLTPSQLHPKIDTLNEQNKQVYQNFESFLKEKGRKQVRIYSHDSLGADGRYHTFLSDSVDTNDFFCVFEKNGASYKFIKNDIESYISIALKGANMYLEDNQKKSELMKKLMHEEKYKGYK